jgi:nitrilase
MDAFTIRVAAVQAESVWLDCPGGIDKFGTLVKAAAAQGAEVVGFPVSRSAVSG